MRQTYNYIEVLLIDGGSKDNTREIAQNYGVNLFEVAGERTVAKNYATKMSKGVYLLFVDSDMILEPTVVADCVAVMQDPLIGGVVVPEKTIGEGYWTEVRNFERSFYEGTKVESARFFRRTEALSVGGFDEDIITYEESTLPQKIEKLGLKINARIGSSLLHDEGKLSITSWLSKKRYYSETLSIYRLRYPEYASIQINVKARAKIFLVHGNWKRLFGHPRLTFGLMILKSLELISAK